MGLGWGELLVLLIILALCSVAVWGFRRLRTTESAAQKASTDLARVTVGTRIRSTALLAIGVFLIYAGSSSALIEALLVGKTDYESVALYVIGGALIWWGARVGQRWARWPLVLGISFTIVGVLSAMSGLGFQSAAQRTGQFSTTFVAARWTTDVTVSVVSLIIGVALILRYTRSGRVPRESRPDRV
jgi:hypothetical protein